MDMFFFFFLLCFSLFCFVCLSFVFMSDRISVLSWMCQAAFIEKLLVLICNSWNWSVVHFSTAMLCFPSPTHTIILHYIISVFWGQKRMHVDTLFLLCTAWVSALKSSTLVQCVLENLEKIWCNFTVVRWDIYHAMPYCSYSPSCI